MCAAARDEPARVTRRVLLARAYDRANATDSAASAYASASLQLTRVADWLRLRQAGVLADSAARSALFKRVILPVARARIQATDAQARERMRTRAWARMASWCCRSSFAAGAGC